MFSVFATILRTLTVTGMKSVGCLSKVTGMLNGLPGVGDFKASLAGGEVTIDFNEKRISAPQLTSAVEEAGYGVDEAGPVHTHLRGGGRDWLLYESSQDDSNLHFEHCAVVV
jgi:copper chaperone CopZ